MPKYRFTSNKRKGDFTTRLILEGTSDNPERFVDMGNEVELSEEEASHLRQRHNLTEIKEETKVESESRSESERAGGPRNRASNEENK